MMHRTQHSLTVFATILMELYSSLSIIYPQHAFAPEDNQQIYLESRRKSIIMAPGTHNYSLFIKIKLCQIVSEDIDLH